MLAALLRQLRKQLFGTRNPSRPVRHRPRSTLPGLELLEDRFVPSGNQFLTSQWATWSTNSQMKVLAGDFNGDGKTDVMKFDVPSSGTSSNGLWVGLSDGSKFNTSQWATWSTNSQMKVLVGDFNGDGKDDVMKFDVPSSGTGLGGLWVGISDGTKFNTSEWAVWYTSTSMQVLAGDFNGDGKTDVMKFDVPSSGTSQNGLWVGLSDGTKFNTSQWATWYTNSQMKVLAGDFNGDGKTDVMKFDVPSSGTSSNGLWVGLSDGTEFNTSEWAIWDTNSQMQVLTGDFNGDGKTDVMKFDVSPSGTSSLGLWVGLSDGTKFNTSEWAVWSTSSQMKVLAGDFNGDHRTDVMKFDVPSSGTASLGLWVGLASNSLIVPGYDWFAQNLSDPALQGLARAEYQLDGRLTRSDLLALFTRVETDGMVSSAEFHDLQTIVAQQSLLGLSAPDGYLMAQVVNGNPANAHYLSTSVGNLFAGSASWRLQELVNKWFLGKDHPTLTSAGAGKTYNPVYGTLFSASGPSFADVYQGQLGDCTVMASMAEVAARNPSLIRGMFTDNGDGTWAVRFYQNGSPVYVTVDNQLPDSGNLYATPFGGVMWVALAEKAYAQLNEEGGLGTLHPGVNSYTALDLGNSDTARAALGALTGQKTDGGLFGYILQSHASDAAATLARGGYVVIGTGDPMNIPLINSTNPVLVTNHEYAVLNYNAATGQFLVFNPWGIPLGSTFNGTPIPVYNNSSIYGLFTANGDFLNHYFDTWARAGSAPSAGVTATAPALAASLSSSPLHPDAGSGVLSTTQIAALAQAPARTDQGTLVSAAAGMPLRCPTSPSDAVFTALLAQARDGLLGQFHSFGTEGPSDAEAGDRLFQQDRSGFGNSVWQIRPC